MSKPVKREKVKEKKQTHYFNVVKAILNHPKKMLTEEELLVALGNPNKQAKSRYLRELTGVEGKVDILNKVKNPYPVEEMNPITGKVVKKARFLYTLKSGYNDLCGLSLEEAYALEAYKHAGSLMNALLTDISFEHKINRNEFDQLERKFFYLSKVQAKPLTQKGEKTFRVLLNSILNNKQVHLFYPSSNEPTGERARPIKPLCICMHRDDLYLIGDEEKFNSEKDKFEWVRKTFKVSRIKDIRPTKESFKYPGKSKWNPADRFADKAGLFTGTSKRAVIKAESHLLTVIREKNFLGANEVESNSPRERFFELSYGTNGEDELLGQLAVYCECVEIISPKSLKEKFYEKLSKGTEKNGDDQKLKKAG